MAAAGLPLADLLAVAAVAGTALLLGWLPGWLLAGYAAAVLAGLTVAGLHRLRICLRVGDQVGPDRDRGGAARRCCCCPGRRTRCRCSGWWWSPRWPLIAARTPGPRRCARRTAAAG